jgi:hypothetical protein
MKMRPLTHTEPGEFGCPGLLVAKKLGLVSGGYQLDQVPHGQEAYHPVFISHCEVANLFFGHEPAGIANCVVNVDLSQGIIRHRPDAHTTCPASASHHPLF